MRTNMRKPCNVLCRAALLLASLLTVFSPAAALGPVEDWVKSIPGDVGGAVIELGDQVSDAGKAAGGAFVDIGNSLSDAAVDTTAAFEDFGEDTAGFFEEHGAAVFDKAAQVAATLPGDALDIAKNIEEYSVAFGEDFASNPVQAVLNVGEDLGNAVADVAVDVYHLAKSCGAGAVSVVAGRFTKSVTARAALACMSTVQNARTIKKVSLGRGALRKVLAKAAVKRELQKMRHRCVLHSTVEECDELEQQLEDQAASHAVSFQLVNDAARCGEDGFRAIRTADECATAATHIGRGFEKRVNQQTRPSGCWLDPNGRVYFNDQPSPSEPWAAPTSICAATNSAVLTAAEGNAVEELAKRIGCGAAGGEVPTKLSGGDTCLAHSNCRPVTTKQECKAAADQLWTPYKGQHSGHNSHARPAGCFLYTGTYLLEFNKVMDTRTASKEFEPICMCRPDGDDDASNIRTAAAPPQITVATLARTMKSFPIHFERHCNSGKCRCDEQAVVTVGIGEQVCRQRCMANKDCNFAHCDGNAADCTCHEFQACDETTTPSNTGTMWYKDHLAGTPPGVLKQPDADVDASILIVREKVGFRSNNWGSMWTAVPESTDLSTLAAPVATKINGARPLRQGTRVRLTVELSNKDVFPTRFELTRVNNKDGLAFELPAPDGGWRKGTQVVDAMIPPSAYIGPSRGDIDWARMTRLELYSSALHARPGAWKITLRDVRIVHSEPAAVLHRESTNFEGAVPLAPGIYNDIDMGSSAYLGCYVDDVHRDLNHGPRSHGHTVDSCATACKDYSHFSLQNGGQCFCDNEYASEAKYSKRPDSECNQGFSRGGGPWRNAVFRQARTGILIVNKGFKVALFQHAGRSGKFKVYSDGIHAVACDFHVGAVQVVANGALAVQH